jgi:glutamate-1-semialdehyde 2,1-aminomutase
MAAIRIARAVTGRPLIVKFEGHYHGWHDAFLVSSHPRDPASLGDPIDPPRVLDSQGLTDGAVADTVLCAWNDAALLAGCLERHPGRVAAVITEPVMANMGVIPPRPGYLEEMRRLCDEHGALLIVDETVTGFRLHPGGCQALYGVTGDLATFGKALGAGLPLAAITGRAEVMDSLAGGRVLHYGTQNAPNLALSVAAESLDILTEDGAAAAAEMTRLGERLAAGLADAFAASGIPAVVQGVGPMLQVLPLRAGHEDIRAIHDMRDFCTHADPALYRRFVHELFALGVYASPALLLHMIVSTAHTDADVGRAIEAAHTAVGRL